MFGYLFLSAVCFFFMVCHFQLYGYCINGKKFRYVEWECPSCKKKVITDQDEGVWIAIKETTLMASTIFFMVLGVLCIGKAFLF